MKFLVIWPIIGNKTLQTVLWYFSHNLKYTLFTVWNAFYYEASSERHFDAIYVDATLIFFWLFLRVDQLTAALSLLLHGVFYVVLEPSAGPKFELVHENAMTCERWHSLCCFPVVGLRFVPPFLTSCSDFQVASRPVFPIWHYSTRSELRSDAAHATIRVSHKMT